MRRRMSTRGPWTRDDRDAALQLAEGLSLLLPPAWAIRVFEVCPVGGPTRYRVEVEGPGAGEPGPAVARPIARFEAGERAG